MKTGTLELAAMNCHHRFYELEDFFSSAKQNGYKFVEIWTGPQHYFMDYHGYESVEKLKKLEEKYDIKVIGICPEQTNPKPNNMAAKDKEMQKRVLRYFQNAIDVACGIQANQVGVTSGWAFFNEPVEEAFQRSVEMLKKVAGYAESKNMNLAIEALQPEESLIANSASELKKLIDAVDNTALKVCLDTGAMARAGDFIQTYFDLFGDKVIHAHFVDVDMEKEITHLAWGDGTRNMSDDIRNFSQNNYRGILSVECVHGKYFAKPFEADRQSMEIYLKQRALPSL